ncbi:DUF6801 domain-containing protein [Streptomyces drozdowiczii]|uniref:DUF2993 domain-containing protein n=1 Tax=Streptomyces drozdowiczii TaxID=202862 RepID=A0ABY6PMQ9_9ACTN|nr:DUF6801 domain-containing protein [Streptomyces drozdowiczii]MCX0247230.1 DUF2993 domain-containing protein [Streptomyces drozdowiczii]UZK53351.1 DUF2993 domain-containing protein [Streptomyces drozdowiczii]
MRVASVAGLALLAGLLSGGGSAADESPGPDGFAAVCGAEDGDTSTVAAAVGVSVDVPATGEVGRPVQPGPATLTVTLSRADLAGLLPEGTEAVVSRAALKVKVAQNGESTVAPWELNAPSTPLSVDGDVALVHSGEVPYVTLSSAGDVDFSVEELTIELRSATTEPDRTAPPLTAVTCRLKEGENGHLATTRVTDGTSAEPSGTPGTPTPPAHGSGRAEEKEISVEPAEAEGDEGPEFCPVEPPEGELDASEAPQPPPGGPVAQTTLPGVFMCANALGLANVQKLNGAMIVNDPGHPALVAVLSTKVISSRQAADPDDPDGNGYYLRIDNLANIKLPDAESTFLTFGFQPVTAKVSFETGPMTISTGNIGYGPHTQFSTVYFKQSLRLHDVKVNGTPLDVGSNCRTEKPFKVVLNGGSAYINVALGGRLDGEVTIPPFSGCGTDGEDLDPLFTAAISGPGNRIFMNQGPTCIPSFPESSYCPPPPAELPGTKPKS